MKLGLIGKAIQRSTMPLLQRLAGERTGHPVDYALLDIADGDPARFDAAFRACADGGFRGVNVTHPFKELAASRVSIEDPRVRAIGAVNTVIFEAGGARGRNTDYTGFLRAWRWRFGDRPTGKVAIIGAGGVGRAIAFALSALGAPEIRLCDVDGDKADALAAALCVASPATAIAVYTGAEAAVAGADGIVNATPIGMHYMPGCPADAAALGGQRWAFDAVYTPEDTELLKAARVKGLADFSGFGLFLGQGADAFEIFTGVALSDDDIAAIERDIRAANATG
jgi:shikimate dehydrogenase